MTQRDRLKEQLRTLHRELEGSEQLDEDLRKLLGQVDEDIHRLLDSATGESGTAAEADALSDQIREAATTFQAEHPRTYRMLREIADALAKLGI